MSVVQLFRSALGRTRNTAAKPISLFVVKLLTFILLLGFLEFLVSIAFPAEIPQEISRLDGYLADGVDVLYLGDSTLLYPPGEVTTGQILQEMLPGHTVGEIAHPAYGLDLYARYVEYVARRDPSQTLHYTQGFGSGRPQAIIIPINMRSFSPEWDRRPGYQFEQEKQILTYGLPLARMLVRPLKVLGAFEPKISQDAFLNTTVYNGDMPVGTVRDFEQEQQPKEQEGRGEFAYHDALPSEEDEEALRKALIYRYMYTLKPDHLKLEAMVDIQRICREKNIRVVFYIIPVNYQQGERSLGSAFSERLSENIALVKSLLAADGAANAVANGTANATLLDLGLSLEAYTFVDMEHLQESGKAYVAEQLATAVQNELLGGDADGQMLATTSTPGSSPTDQRLIEPAKMPTLIDSIAEPSPLSTVAERTSTTAQTHAPKPVTVTVVDPGPTATPSPPSPTLTPTLIPPTTVSASGTITAGASRPLAIATVTPTLTPTTTSHAQDADEKGPEGTVISARHLAHLRTQSKYAIDMYRLQFQTRDENDQLVTTRADMYIPQVEVTTSFPVLAYAPGTTGIGDGCAPLDEQAKKRQWGNYHGHSLTYAAQGFIVILPNWLGFDDGDLTRTHPYFIAELQAHVLLDAAQAVYYFFDHAPPDDVLARPDKAVFFMGYSSGGHAAFAAKDYATTYAPGLPVKGIIGHGPTTNVETLLRENPLFSPYIIYAYRDFYEGEVIDPAEVFLPRWIPTFNSDALTKCVDDIFVYYTPSARGMYRPEFRDILYGNKLAEALPLFAEKLRANDAGISGGRHIPVLILQGTGDTVVTPPSQKKFMNELCKMGTSVTYLEYPAVSHPEIRRMSFGDTLSWMQYILQGGVPRSDCVDSTLAK